MSLFFRRALASFAGLLLTAVASGASAQQQGTPGRFDFYLMNLAWAPDFCSVPGASAACKPHPGFILHGLWAQNNDGSYPVSCSHEPGPADLAANLDLTPDIGLLQHEWDKHGTCSNVGPARFFALERSAFRSFKVPHSLAHVDRPLTRASQLILSDFYAANPSFPRGSILLSCKDERLTAVEACFSKDLKPIACRGLHTCAAPVLRILPLTTAGR